MLSTADGSTSSRFQPRIRRGWDLYTRCNRKKSVTQPRGRVCDSVCWCLFPSAPCYLWVCACTGIYGCPSLTGMRVFTYRIPAFLYARVPLRTCISAFLFARMSPCMYVRLCMHLHLRGYLCERVSICVCVCVHDYASMHLCLCVHICLCM